MFVGEQKRREFWYELGAYVAWHVAVFNTQAKAGKLVDWSTIRQRMKGTTDVPIPMDWRIRKAQRQAQVANLRKHNAARARPPKVRHGS